MSTECDDGRGLRRRSTSPIRFTPLGDRAVTITLGDSIDEETNRLVQAAAAAIDRAPPAGVVETMRSFASVTVHYDPLRVVTDDVPPHTALVSALERVLRGVTANDVPPARVVEIPVCYGGDLGPDLEDVAHRHGLSPDDVVRIHTDGRYRVYMVGFMPGFAYLGGLSNAIVTPRRPSPRKAVPAGSVGIGGNQTGIYPMDSPGGWNLIGRTPLKIFDLGRERPALLAAGDAVHFRAISPSEYQTLSGTT